MKHLLLALALTVPIFGQPIKSPGVNGENLINPAFRNSVLPLQTGNAGKYLTTDGTAATWATVSSNLTSGPVTSSGGVSSIAAGAITNGMLATNPSDAANLTTGTVQFARLVNTQTVGNVDASITAGTRDVILTVALTAARTYTLPLASAYPAGSRISFSDSAITLTATNTATLARAGSDLINGATTMVLNTAGAAPILISDGASRWTMDIRGVSRGGTGVTSLTGIAKGNGTLPFTAAVAGTDYLAPNGNGSLVTNLNADNLTTGRVAIERLINTQSFIGNGGTITAGTRDALITTAPSASSVYVLPAATTGNGYPAGSRLTFTDIINCLTPSLTATLQPASGGYINNVLNGTIVLSTAGASPMLISDGSGRWNLDIRGVARGGTGVTTLTGIVKGNGTLPHTPAVAGTDYVIPSGNISGTAAGLSVVNTGALGGTGVANTGKTLTLGASLATTGTDIPTFIFPSAATARNYTYPVTSATLARTDAAQTFTGIQTFVAPVIGAATGTSVTTTGGLVANSGGAKATLLGYPGGESTFSGLWLAVTPSTSNYAFLGDGSNTFLNANTGGTVALRVANQTVATVSSTGFAITGTLAVTGASTLNTASVIRGGASTTARVGGAIFESFADVTVGGTETDIFSNTLDASLFGTNGQKVVAEYSGNFVTVGTEMTQLQVKFAGNLLWDSTGVAPSTGTTSWRVTCTLIRVSSTVVRYSIALNTSGASGFVYCTVGELTGLTLTGTNILKITGFSTGVNSGIGDIIGKMHYVDYKSQS